MEYIMVIDGGGTKTRGCIYDLDGQLQAEAISGFANPLVDFDTTKKNIQNCIENLLVEYPTPKHVVLGIAGIGNTTSFSQLNCWIEEYLDISYTLVTDATLAYFAAFSEQRGILSIIGTGSIHYYYDGIQLIKVGGWGHILGDEGSSYSLSLQVLKHAIQMYELTGDENSALIQSIKDFYNIKNLEELKSVVYQKDKSLVASLSKFIIKQKDQYDLNSFIHDEINKIVEQIILLSSRNESIKKVVVSGGLIMNSDFYYELLKDRITKQTNLCIERLVLDPTLGGFYIYINDVLKENVR